MRDIDYTTIERIESYLTTEFYWLARDYSIDVLS